MNIILPVASLDATAEENETERSVKDRGQSVYSSPKKVKAGGYPPISLDAYRAIASYVAIVRASIISGELYESSPTSLLLDGLPHGPITSARVGKDPNTGKECVSFRIRNKDRSERHVPPVVFAVIRVMLAFGGGIALNDTSKRKIPRHPIGLAYLTFFGGADKVSLGRVVLHAGMDEIALYRSPTGSRIDHHSLDLAHMEVGRVRSLGDRRSRLNPPKRGRDHAIEVALRFHGKNRLRMTGGSITKESYALLLKETLELCDWLRSQS